MRRMGSQSAIHLRMRLVVAAAAFAIACGGDYGTDPDGNNNENNSGNTSVKVLTATINGTPFTAATLNGAYLGGSLSINGFNTLRSLTISAINLTGPGTYSLSIGNQRERMVQSATAPISSRRDSVAPARSRWTTATLFRLTGTFSFTAYTSAGGGLGNPVVTVINGVFDISVP